MTLDGDIAVENGDIALTSGEEWYIREVNKRLRSGRDWKHHPSLGANLQRFNGEANSRETGRRIKDAVSQSLGQDSIHFPGTLDVSVIPTSLESVNVVVAVNGIGQRFVASHIAVNIENGLIEPVQEPEVVDHRDEEDPNYANDYTAPNNITNKYQRRFRRD